MQVSSLVLLRRRFSSRTTRTVPGPRGIRQCKAPSCATLEGTVPCHDQDQNHHISQCPGLGRLASRSRCLQDWRRVASLSGTSSYARSFERSVYCISQRTEVGYHYRRRAEEMLRASHYLWM